jgi:hypothetical protein
MRAFMLVLVLLASADAVSAPRVKSVTLEALTTLVVYIPPSSLGTRFLFPFVLDEQDSYVPFTLQITNTVFHSKREPGRNSFVVTVPDVPVTDRTQYVGNMFVTVAGYEITVELRTSSELSRHYSDIQFKLGAAERESLIQQGIAQRTLALEADYAKKIDDLEKQIDQKSIARVGVLAQKKPSIKRIKEETKMVLANGDHVTLYVDESQSYGAYTIFVFQVEARDGNSAVTILDAKLFALNRDTKTARPIESAHDVPPRVTSGEIARGVLTTFNQALNPKELLKLQVLTDKGVLEATW